MAKSKGKKRSSRARARRAQRTRRARTARGRSRPAGSAARRRRARTPRRTAHARGTAVVLTPDDLEALRDTQDLEPERTRTGVVGPSPVDVERAQVLAGGDVDADSDDQGVGEESVGGSTPTPDQDVVDELGRAAGVTYADEEPLRPGDKIARRDEHRWEEDPASSEDYEERERALRSPEPRRPMSRARRERPTPRRPRH